MEWSYAAAGVDIDAAGQAVELIRQHARTTFRSEVLSDIGPFGALFQLQNYRSPVLVSSTDGVGTKLKIAVALGRHDTVGIDLVNHCVNDILTQGAEPLFFLDYLAVGKLIPQQVEEIAQGLAQACRQVGCAFIGGETAQMPDFYAAGEYDLAGFIVGVVERDSILDGRSIEEGDVLLGLPSSGLHTNGYTLVRRLFELSTPDPAPLHAFYPELGRTLGEELLEPHRCYYPLLKPVLPLLRGMAHITGGGLPGNVARLLPQGLAARFAADSWAVPPIFSLIQQRGRVPAEEMRRVFNLGLGMVLFCSPENARQVKEALPEARPVGEVVRQEGEERVVVG